MPLNNLQTRLCRRSTVVNLVCQWTNFFQRTHHSSVEHLPKVFGQERTGAPMILTQDMLNRCRMDGGEDSVERYHKKIRPSVTALSKLDLPKRLPPDDLYEPKDALVPDETSEPMKKGLVRGQALSATPSYGRIQTLQKGCSSGAELDAASWLQMYVQGAWQVQARATLHVRGPSCWKYNKTGTRVCRHCYHITVFQENTLRCEIRRV